MKIRSVRPEDAEQILEIYSPHVTDTPVSFETEVPTLLEFKKRIEEYTAKFPWIVAEINGEIAGYAYASTHRSRAAYEWSVECSVYIDKSHQGKKIGTALYAKLFEMIKAQGAVNVYAGITLPNEGSIRLHESMGFFPIGTFKDVGFKLGKWWDVGWWQLQLQLPVRPQPLTGPEKLTE
jgi:phosphinothricin acetyltransferase